MCTCDICTVQVTLVCKSCQNKLIVPDAVSYHDNLVLELKGPSEVTMTWIGESGLGKLVGVSVIFFFDQFTSHLVILHSNG